MLTNEEAEWLSLLVNHVDGVAELPSARVTECCHALRKAVAEALSARVAMQRGALKRHEARVAAGLASGGGRPPSIVYEVSLGSLWSMRVLGVADVVDLVNTTLAENQGGNPLSKNGLSVALSTKGAWWRHLYTDQGEHDLTVRKVGGLPEASAEEAEPVPAKPTKSRKG